MRLLSTHTHAFQEFISDYDIPKYAILSHTWEAGEEVTYQEWQAQDNVSISHKKGFIKIEAFRAEALRDGFDWVWVDTCCIDKTSSAELSEAINSMFRWYRDSSICYTYLADVSSSDLKDIIWTQMSKSRWFTRGWTLQELIAPSEVRFYTDDWRLIGTKSEMSWQISTITGVDVRILLGADLETASVARRMSWASQRKTTRTEDVAYCLLGIFDVNLPLIYGEGKKAFQRLQEAIMLRSHDQSLFAWGEFTDDFSDLSIGKEAVGFRDYRQVIRWEGPKKPQPAVGLFAETPEAFRLSMNISPLDDALTYQLARTHPPVLASGGVRLGIVIWRRPDSYRVVSYSRSSVITTRPVQIAILACQNGDSGHELVGFLSYPWGSGYYARTPELIRISAFEIRDLQGSFMNLSDLVCTRHFMRERKQLNKLSRGETLLERIYIGSKAEDGPTSPPGVASTKSHNNTTGIDLHKVSYDLHYGQRLSIRFARLPNKPGNRTGDLLAEVALENKDCFIPLRQISRVISPSSKRFIFENEMNTPLVYIIAKRDIFVTSDEKSWDVDIVDLYISTKDFLTNWKGWVRRAETSIRSREVADE